jgi:hypothetical protein
MINLEGNEIDMKGTKILSQIIEKNKKIKILNLGSKK